MMTVMMMSHSSAPVLSPAKGQHSHREWMRLVDKDFIYIWIILQSCVQKCDVSHQNPKWLTSFFLLCFDSFWAKPKKNGQKTKHTHKKPHIINCKMACRCINIPFFDRVRSNTFPWVRSHNTWLWMSFTSPISPYTSLKAYGQLRHTVLNKCVASVCVMYEHLCEHGFLCVSTRPCMYMMRLSLVVFFSPFV